MPDYNELKRWIQLAERDYSVAFFLHEKYLPNPTIKALNELCVEHTDKVQINERVADALTDYAVMARYVDDRRDFTEDTAKFALKQAEQTLKNVKQFLKVD